ncbi:DUF6011 domain-containing protein [Streptomyces sp. CB01881]|uniref:DUF6011 domain-containing protein n=1 Tax=Streptomyces sp. CB01881 TaxID=2078691 RepID=UPI000CDC17CC|nr:DUF6011 domain-containing protein [Streptomyces sp. CB01881]AUY50152.1 hypothetical protein C2142_15840 [Streptomyces sp. CB01881]TYC73544.1 hypothetical protein EH183_15820 [Streptomyces sp. CB01881]
MTTPDPGPATAPAAGPATSPATGPAPEPLPGTDAPEVLRPRVTCRRCHRPLHDPESRMLRLGPECRDPAERVARHEVEQDTLPGMDGP